MMSLAHRAAIGAALRGRKHTPSHCAAMSASRLGKKRGPHTVETRAKIGAGNRGKKRTPAQITAMVARLIGKKLPPRTAEYRQALSERQRGERGNNWRGGLTAEQKRIRNSVEYAAWRLAVFARDNWTCHACGQHGGRLNADHIKAFSTHPQLRMELTNGVTLCVDCHRKTPNFGWRAVNARRNAELAT